VAPEAVEMFSEEINIIIEASKVEAQCDFIKINT